eukprot:SAG22_NODE_403_length_11012_cov_12.141024_14_plen_155_part_00
MRVLTGSHKPIMGHWDKVLRDDRRQSLPRVHGLGTASQIPEWQPEKEHLADVMATPFAEQQPTAMVARRGQVSHKALPLPCASTVCLSKTAPFLAVRLHSTGTDLHASLPALGLAERDGQPAEGLHHELCVSCKALSFCCASTVFLLCFHCLSI